MTEISHDFTGSGAYALGAMTDAELAEFELWMLDDEQLRAEVTELSDTAIELGLSVRPELPSPELRSRILGALDQIPQVPQVVVPRARTHAEHRADVRWFRRPVMTVASAAAALAVIVGGIAIGTSMLNAPSPSTVVSALSHEADSGHRTDRIAGGGIATATWSASEHRSAVEVTGLKALASNKTYELWYIDGSGARRAGTFTPQGHGKATVVLSGTFSAGDTIGMTVEPAGGSDQPTSAPIVAIRTT